MAKALHQELESKKLEILRSLQNDIARHQAKISVLEAELKSMVVEVLIGCGIPVNTGGVCLLCGLVRRNVRLPCSCERSGDS